MPIINEHDFHTFNWVDLVTTDPQDAMAFYGALMGWSFEEQVIDGELAYAMATRDERLVAGLRKATAMDAEDWRMARQAAGLSVTTPEEQQEQGVPPHWNAYLCVEDAHEAVARCETSGAKALHPPIDVEAGIVAIVVDPQGAAFFLWQPKAHQGMQLIAEPGAFLWAELNTSDAGAAQTFYGQAFGWGAENDPNNEAYTVFTRESVAEEGRYVAGMMEIQPEWGPVPPHWLVYFTVADTDAALQQVLELGGSKVTDVMEIPQGRFAIVKDPQGAIFTIMTSMHV